MITKILDKPKVKDAEVLAQGRIPPALKEAVEVQFKKDRESGKLVNWQTLIKTACEMYLKERQLKK